MLKNIIFMSVFVTEKEPYSLFLTQSIFETRNNAE